LEAYPESKREEARLWQEGFLAREVGLSASARDRA
jgi:hypothetical protein